MTVIVDDNDLRIGKLVLGPYETNCYVLTCKNTQQSLVVDAPAEASAIIKALNGTQPRYILLTHGHFDHTGALAQLRSQLKVPLAAHPAASSMSPEPTELYLNDGDRITLGDLEVTVLHTPGHTPGSVCFKTGKHFFAGDTIFPGGPGHTDSPDNFTQIVASITRKILTLPDDTIIYPGHGESGTVGKSREEYAVFASRRHPKNLCGDVLWISS
jgi:hydroxyacylglutathione hydrolase